MSTEKQQVAAQTDWKCRYHEVLDELQTKQHAWQETESQLRLLLTQLTQVTDTQQPVLKKQLAELRSALADGSDILQFQSMIADIGEQISALDKSVGSAEKNQHPDFVFVEVLDKLDLPAELSRRYKKLRKKISKLSVSDSDTSISTDFLDIIRQLLTEHKQDESGTRRQKLLGRILSRAKNTDAQNGNEQNSAESSRQTQPVEVPQRFIAPAVGELLLQLALRLPDQVKQRINFVALKKHTNRARRRKDLLPIIDVIAQQVDAAYHQQQAIPIDIQHDSVNAVSQAVRQLLHQLEPPADLNPQLARLEVFYADHATEVDGLIHCLHQISEIVAEVCNRLALQRNKLESFIVQLAGDLQDLGNGVQQASVFTRTGQENSEQLGVALQQEMHAMRESLQSVNDITRLKTDIQSKLDVIEKHIERYCENENQCSDQTQNVIAGLTETIGLIEKNTQDSRDILQEIPQLVSRDVLTGIANRQAYEQRLSDELARCRRYGAPLSLIAWDIDHFKNVNDSFGHAAGDRVLRVVAELLVSRLRETDFTVRYEGEKFVTLMPETTLEAAIQVANKLRHDIEQLPFYFRDSRVLVTISAGVAQYQKDDLINSLYERADTALYRAKGAGRNQVRA